MIYFDNSATTKISDEALETYIRVSNEEFGNPSSLHAVGHAAEKRLNESRDALRHALGAKGGEVIFTAGGTEANNLAIFGRAFSKERYIGKGKILTTEGEHASVTVPLAKLKERGIRTVAIPTRGGVLDMDVLRREMTPDVILVTMMMVNNETGALYPLSDVAQVMRRQSPEAILHADATQSFGKVPFTVRSIGADMVTVSSHKIEGPKGVGALFASDDVIKKRGLAAVTLGGGQEDGFRSGTENVPGIAAFGVACRLAEEHLAERAEHMSALRTLLTETMSGDDLLRTVSLTLPPVHAPHILNMTLPSVKSETMLHFLSAEGICVSSGSACSSHGHHASGALLAYGRSEAEADTSVRVSFSHRNTSDEVLLFCDALKRGLMRLARIKK